MNRLNLEWKPAETEDVQDSRLYLFTSFLLWTVCMLSAIAVLIGFATRGEAPTAAVCFTMSLVGLAVIACRERLV